jgi:hypothetical protein
MILIIIIDYDITPLIIIDAIDTPLIIIDIDY